MLTSPTVGRALSRALALLGVMALPGTARAQLSVNELEVFLKPNVSVARTGVIRITNDTDHPVQALLDVQDWNRDERGANQFLPLGTSAGSCRDHVKVFPASVRVEPRRSEPVRISFDGAAATSCWSIVFVRANEPAQAAAQASQITYVMRTGVKVYVQPDNAARTGDVDTVRLADVFVSERDTARVRGIEVLFRNTGSAHLKPTGAVEVRDANNAVAAKLDIAQFPIAPGDSRRIQLPLPKLPPGRYIALALLDYAGPDIAAGQAEFEFR